MGFCFSRNDDLAPSGLSVPSAFSSSAPAASSTTLVSSGSASSAPSGPSAVLFAASSASSASSASLASSVSASTCQTRLRRGAPVRVYGRKTQVTCTTTRHYYPWWNANDLEWKCNDTKRLRTKDFKPGVFVEIIDPLDPRHTPLASIFLDPSPSIYQRTVFAELDLVSPRV